ncbi:nucleic acid-binding, OB-fold-like protein [Carex rostrata]
MALASVHARLLLSSTSASFLRGRLIFPSPAPALSLHLPSPLAFFPRPFHRASFCSSVGDELSATAVTVPSSVEKEAEVKEEEDNGKDPVREAAEALDIRVGKVVKAWLHPEADSLFVEEVDLGESEPRTICSGLVNYVPLELLQDSKVVVLANLKPRNMRGIKSNGMLMAASDEAHENVELLVPPEGSVPGERIWFGSENEKDKQPNAATPNQVQKKKIWESVQPHLKTTEACVAVLDTLPMRTSAGEITCKSLKNARIS